MRKKIHITIKLFLLLVMVICVYKIFPGTLAELIKEKVEPGNTYKITYKTKVDNEYDIKSLKINDPEGIDMIWNFLEETEVSFETIIRPPNLMDGEIWYEITDMQHLKSMHITDSGKVYTMLFHIPQLNAVYSISDDEVKDIFAKIEEIRKTYGVE